MSQIDAADNVGYEGASPVAQEERVEKLRTGQKLVICAILLHVLASVAYAVSTSVSAELALVMSILWVVGALFALIVGWIGIFRLASGLGTNVVVTIVLMLGMLVPVVGAIILLILSSMATGELRKAGYKVGLLGASS